MKPTLRCALAALLAIAAPATAEPPQAAFSGTTSVLEIEVPVRVLSDGHPVRGLTAADFTVRDRGRVRPLTSFEVVDLSESPPSSASTPGFDLPAGARRHILLFFDLTFTPIHGVADAERATRRLVREQLHPSDLVAIAFYSDRKGVAMPLYFTSDRAEVERVLDELATLLGSKPPSPNAVKPRPADPLSLVAGDFAATAIEIGLAGRSASLLGDEESEMGIRSTPRAEEIGVGDGKRGQRAGAGDVLTLIDEQFREARLRELQNRVEDLAASLEAVARLTRWVEGSKHLVLLSSGFPEETYVGPLSSGTRRAMVQMIEALRRSGWAVHAIEATRSTSETPGQGVGTGPLAWMALDTGGTLLRNFNDLSAATERVLLRTEYLYLLRFASEATEDGQFHKLSVKVKNAPRGARVHARAGYFAPTPYAAWDDSQRLAAAAEELLTGTARDELGARVESRREADGTLVVRVALSAAAAEDQEYEVYIYALDAAGSLVDFATGVMRFPAARDFTTSLVLPPVPVQLRTLVRERRTGRVTLSSVPVGVAAAEPIR
jgi:VWFA-related protein